MKSGNDLWKAFTGWSESSPRASSDWTDVRSSMTSPGSRSTSLAIPDGERGLTIMTTAPIVDLTMEYTSGSPSLNAIWRIDVYRESRVVLGLNRVLPSGAVHSGSFRMTSN